MRGCGKRLRTLATVLLLAMFYSAPLWALSSNASLKIDAYKDKDLYLQGIPTIVINFTDSDEPNDIGLVTDLTPTITKYVTSKNPKNLSTSECTSMTLFTLEILSGPNNSTTGYEVYIKGDKFYQVDGTNTMAYSLIYAYTPIVAYNYSAPNTNISKRTGKAVSSNGQTQRISVGTRGTNPIKGSWYLKTDVAMAIQQTEWDRITALGNSTYQATITVSLNTV